ncbi:hypothetical protein COK63_04665 [Bacillus cereus]|nr:hypothetical protein COK63_04665 [Bacillus cereus]
MSGYLKEGGIMSNITGFGLGLLIIMLLVFFQVDLSSVDNMYHENQQSIDIATNDSMSLAINKGNLRVNEAMTIDYEVANATLIKSYAKNTSFNLSNSARRIEVHGMNSATPMLSVGARTKQGSFTKKYFENWGSFKNDSYINAVDKELLIIESKHTEKPPKGGVYDNER